MCAPKEGNRLYQLDGMIHGYDRPERESVGLLQLTFAAGSAKLWRGAMILRLLRLLILVGVFGLSSGLFAAKPQGVKPAVTANPSSFNYNFAINPQTGGYPKTVTGTFTLTITGSGPDPTHSLVITGFTPSPSPVLKDSKGKTVTIPGPVPAGTYTLTIIAPDPGQGAQKTPWSVDVNLDSGKLGKATTKISGTIGRDLPPQPQQMGAQQMAAQQMAAQQMAAQQMATQQMATQQMGGQQGTGQQGTGQQGTGQQGTGQQGGNAGTPAKTLITPWGGGLATPYSNPFITASGGINSQYNPGQRYAVMLNVASRKLQIGTAVSVANKPIAHSPKTTLGGNIRPARQIVRGGKKLNMGFVRYLNMSPTELVKHTPAPPRKVEPPPRKMVSGFISPRTSVRRIFGGNVAIQGKYRTSGRARGTSHAARAAKKPTYRRRR